MASENIETRLNRVAALFQRERESRGGKRVSKYPDTLWEEVVQLTRAGVTAGKICERCGIVSGTLTQGLGRAMARARAGVNMKATALKTERLLRVKTLEVEPPSRPPEPGSDKFEVLFPNGVCVRLPAKLFDEAMIARLKSC